MPSSRKCIFGCKGDGPLFTLPKDDAVRQKWLDFIFGNEPPFKNSIVYVCARHFTEDCFLNKTLFDNGQISRLSLKEGAVLTIKSEPIPNLWMERCNDDIKPTSNRNPPAPPRIQGSAYTTCTRSTQLSMGTLRSQHYRSKGVQAAVSTVSRGTSDVWERPPKRPRVKLEEEEVPASSASSFEPEDSVTDMADLIDMKSPSDFEDAKYIVFESALRELFENCPVCRRHCIVHQRRCGTFVAFSQNCPHCFFSRKWQSQPMKGKIPQGDLELSAAVYFNGESFTNIEKICNTMNLKVHQYYVFRRHSQSYLEPAIYHKWKADQSKVLDEMKRRGKIAVSGDMRVDSPGKSAKFGSYTMMGFGDNKILDIQLVQSNEVGSSVNLEKEGLGRSLDLLEANSVEVAHIVVDRHPEVQRYLQERQTPHYYNVQHVVKGLSQKLEALAKKKDCQVVKKWLPNIKRHLYWTARSSTTASEKVAKWTSLLNHIHTTHTQDDPLFPKGLHPNHVSTDGNESFNPALNKVEKILLNKRMFEEVSKLSSRHQTSSLESFHSLMKCFEPKNTDFPFTEKLCRLYLAAMHHNENAAKGKPLWKLKSKRRTPAGSVQTDATYRYRSDLMQLVLTEMLDDPAEFQKKLQKEPVPSPFTSDCDMPPHFTSDCDLPPPFNSHCDMSPPFTSPCDMSPPFTSHCDIPIKEEIVETQI